MSAADLTPFDHDRAVAVASKPRFRPARYFRAVQRELKEGSNLRDAARAVIVNLCDPNSRHWPTAAQIALRGDVDWSQIIREESAQAPAAFAAPRINITTNVQPVAAQGFIDVDATSVQRIECYQNNTTGSGDADVTTLPDVVEVDAASGPPADIQPVVADVLAELRASRAVLAAQMARIDAVLARAAAATEKGPPVPLDRCVATTPLPAPLPVPAS